MAIVGRHLSERVVGALATSRVVNVVGPRQVGKTTLVRDLMRTAYYTLDDDSVREALEADPYGQLRLLAEREDERPIVLDEVQRLPAITLALKRIVDEDPRPGRFILTGSSDIFTSGQAYDSLAGRVMTLTLRPLSAAEVAGAAPCRLLDLVRSERAGLPESLPEPRASSREEAIELIVRGGFPEIRNLSDADRMARYASYLDSIVERDVAAIAAVRKPDVLRRLLDQAAARTAEELGMSSLSNLLDVRQETVAAYLDVFSRLGLIHRLGAWTSAAARKEIKAPKLHFLDTGCATSLRGEDSGSFRLDRQPMALGPLLETFVFGEIEKSLPFAAQRWRLYHWRQTPREIDLLAESPGGWLALFEVKAATAVQSSDFRHIDWFFAEGPGKSQRGAGFVVYLGEKILSFGQGKIALPLSMLWSFA